MHMDCFVDEVKDGGIVTGLGVLLLEAGVTEGLDGQLNRPIATAEGSGCKIGEIHWSDMHEYEANIAKQWLTYFLQGPMMFFVYAKSRVGESKADTLKRLILTLEADQYFLGFHRSTTVVHFDTDRADHRGLLRDLRRNFGLLRAFKWNSKGSRLLQLSDLLLGITLYLTKPSTTSLDAQPSKGELLRQDIISILRSEATRFADHGKINAILLLDEMELRYLLSEQSSMPHCSGL